MTRDARELGGAWTRFQGHTFPGPSRDVARYVERYWMVSWNYHEPYRQLIVPYPNVHLTFQDGAATVHGVSSGHQVKVLEGANGVFGVAFRPGWFRPFLRTSISTIRDRSIDATEVFGQHDPSRSSRSMRLDLPDPLAVETVERFLGAHLPEPDPTAEEAADMVARIAAKPEITRVDALARQVGRSVRQLQRLFAEYVGIGPKWVIRRYRLHEVTERLATGAEIEWASLAAELGYADQAHFVRDFKEMFGEPPTWYAARY